MSLRASLWRRREPIRRACRGYGVHDNFWKNSGYFFCACHCVGKFHVMRVRELAGELTQHGG